MYRLARWTVAAAFLASAGSACLGVVTARFSARRWWRWVVVLAAVAFVGLTLATATLTVGLLTRDFRLLYVDAHTDTELPLYYALSALWAGSQGSLLFWTFLLAACDAVFLLTARRMTRGLRTLAHAVLASLVCFFTGLVVVYADAFVTYRFPPGEGTGLRDALQNVQMLFHPPTLYLGYLLFAVPFAVVAAALVSGRPMRDALRRSRPWLLAAWTFLTLGNLLGMQWAYVELGWGGYWSWDPVENASLIPWLSATALLHTLGLVRRRRVQPAWGAALALLTFLLCLLGVLLTRGGLVVSMHAFAPSRLAPPLLAGVVAVFLASAGLVVWQWRNLTSETVRAFQSRDWLLAVTAVTLAGLATVVLVGTWWPAMAAAWASVAGPSESVPTLTRTFYDRVALPAAVVLIAVLWGCSWARARTQWWLAAVALAPGGFIAWALLRHGSLGAAWSVVVVVLVTLGVGAALSVLGRMTWGVAGWPRGGGSGARSWRQTWLGLAHAGVAVLVVGLSISEGFSRSEGVVLGPGGSTTAAGVTLEFQGRALTQSKRYEALVASIKVTKPGQDPVLLRPELRAYHGRDDLDATLVVRTGLREDLLVAVTKAWPDGRVKLLVRRRPGVLWIWIGGGLMVLGGAGLTALRRRRSPPGGARDEE